MTTSTDMIHVAWNTGKPIDQPFVNPVLESVRQTILQGLDQEAIQKLQVLITQDARLAREKARQDLV